MTCLLHAVVLDVFHPTQTHTHTHTHTNTHTSLLEDRHHHHRHFHQQCQQQEYQRTNGSMYHAAGMISIRLTNSAIYTNSHPKMHSDTTTVQPTTHDEGRPLSFHRVPIRSHVTSMPVCLVFWTVTHGRARHYLDSTDCDDAFLGRPAGTRCC